MLYEKEIKAIAHAEAVRWYMSKGYNEKQATKMADWTIYKK